MYTEEEQLDQIRQWWGRYGKLILVGLVIVVVIVSGWRYWQTRQRNIAKQASILFDHMLVSKDKADDVAFEGQGNYLLNTYPRSLYAEMGALIMAKHAIDKGDLNQGGAHLQWVLDHGSNNAMRQLARLRLARVQLAQKHYDKAKSTLKTVEDKAYIAEVYAVRGDIALAQDAIATARDNYQLALGKMTKDTDLKQLYLLKLQQLPAQATAKTSKSTST